MIFETFCEEETSRFGQFIGTALQRPLTILLQGDLGTGKSVVARALARGLGVPEDIPITSPTFTLMNQYAARLELYHFDLYRLADADELTEIGFDEFAFGQGVALVEWPERLDRCDFDHLLVQIKRLAAERRQIELRACGKEALSLLESVTLWLQSEKKLPISGRGVKNALTP